MAIIETYPMIRKFETIRLKFTTDLHSPENNHPLIRQTIRANQGTDAETQCARLADSVTPPIWKSTIAITQFLHRNIVL